MKISNWITTLGFMLCATAVTGNNYLATLGPPPLRFRPDPEPRAKVIAALPELPLKDPETPTLPADPLDAPAPTNAPPSAAAGPADIDSLLSGIGAPPAFDTNRIALPTGPLLAPDLNGVNPGRFTPQMIVPFLQSSGATNARPGVVLPPSFIPPSGAGVLPSRAIYTRSRTGPQP